MKNGQPKPKCMIPECDRPQYSRGLCRPCYQAAMYAVRTEKTTWELLETLGLAVALPANRGGGLFKKAFGAAVAQPEAPRGNGA